MSVGARRPEQPCFFEVHRLLQFEQHDVVDAPLVAKLGDGPTLVFEHTETDLPNQIALHFGVGGCGAVIAESDQCSVLSVFGLQSVL